LYKTKKPEHCHSPVLVGVEARYNEVKQCPGVT